MSVVLPNEFQFRPVFMVQLLKLWNHWCPYRPLTCALLSQVHALWILCTDSLFLCTVDGFTPKSLVFDLLAGISSNNCLMDSSRDSNTTWKDQWPVLPSTKTCCFSQRKSTMLWTSASSTTRLPDCPIAEGNSFFLFVWLCVCLVWLFAFHTTLVSSFRVGSPDWKASRTLAD